MHRGSLAKLRSLLGLGQAPSASDVFCTACREEDNPDRVISGADMLQSSERGCSICRLLCSILAAFEFGPVSDDDTFMLSGDCGQLSHLYAEPLGWLEIYGTSEVSSPVTWLKFATDVAFDSTIASCLAVVRGWVESCDQDHETCRRGMPGSLPLRVLDLGLPGLDGPLRLYETKGERERYIALSHCWGAIQPLTTETATLAARTKDIPNESLPKTFRDAIIIARELSVRFLWIDSLCIIQDDRLDWEVQSAKMCDVYENAYLTIAAAGAPNGSYGFLSPRVEFPTRTVQFKDSKRSFAVRVRKVLSHFQEDTIHSNRLMTRAWFLQEWLVSHRVLSYRFEEMDWQCRFGRICECNAQHVDLNPSLLGWEDYSNGLSHNISLGLTYHHWCELVNQYTQMELTKSTDRLPALSALAAKFKAKTNDIYLAGLWKNDLVVGFTWRPNPELGELPQEYRAPSWCWSSLDGEVRYSAYSIFSREKWEIFVEILEVQCIPAGQNPFGDIRDGFVKVRGQLVAAVIELPAQYDVGWSGCKIWPESHPYCAISHFTPDVPLSINRVTIGSGKSEYVPARAKDWLFNPDCGKKIRVRCLLVAENPIYHYVLVLGLSQRVTGAYERLGILELNKPHSTEAHSFMINWAEYTQELKTIILV